jgi:hypothetical protein
MAYVLFDYSVMFQVFAVLSTILAFYFTYKLQIDPKTGASTITIQPVSAVASSFFAVIFWSISSFSTVNIKYIGNFVSSGATSYIDLGNEEFTYPFIGFSLIMSLYLLYITQYFLQRQWQ